MARDHRRLRCGALALLIATAITLASCDSRNAAASSKTDAALIPLGTKLFTDTRLSADGRISCASCHAPGRFFMDARKVSIGIDGRSGTRNAPSLLDIATMQSFFWDGRESRLQDAVLRPFTNTVEMGLASRAALAGRIRSLPEYSPYFGASRREDDAAVADAIGTALSAYLRSLPQARNRYDLHRRSHGRLGLNDEEKNGLALFSGKAACAGCHRLDGAPAALTDNRFHHTGVGFERIAGNIGALVRRLDAPKQQGAIGNAVLSDRDVAELGRFVVTRKPADLGAFRTPSLRNVARTAPYMHDGSVGTLEQAVEREIYYRSLARGRPISLTIDEQRQLIAFLRALTDEQARAPPAHRQR